MNIWSGCCLIFIVNTSTLHIDMCRLFIQLNISVNWFKCEADYFMKFVLELVLSVFNLVAILGILYI